jgi:peptidoglycan/LPS O-acetylase OafA/YrhL
MFFWIDAVYNSPVVAAWDGIISATLTQAWFPLSAEEWNGPTWVLSALMFCYLPFPYALKVLGRQTKSQLRRTLWILTILSLLPKLGYTYDLEVWSVREEAWNMNYTLFNCLQFSPLSAFLEVLMGATAYRLVMLDTDRQTAGTGSSMWPLMALIAVLVLRALKLMTINDLLVRAGIFLPIFIAFVMRMHRENIGLGSQSRCSNKVVPAILNLGLLKWLSDIAIPILVVHGPVGQLLFAPLVARKLWGRNLARIPGFFGVYWGVIIGLSYLLNKYFVQNKKVGEVSKDLTAKICKRLSD